MEDNIFDKVHEVDLKKTMETSYIDYAMSVIASRALPDVRDGLKPVQRRVLFSMIELNNGPDKPHRKCARIVGDTWVNIIRTVTVLSMEPWLIWHRTGPPVIRWLTDMETSVLWMETARLPCDILRRV